MYLRKTAGLQAFWNCGFCAIDGCKSKKIVVLSGGFCREGSMQCLGLHRSFALLRMTRRSALNDHNPGVADHAVAIAGNVARSCVLH